MELIDGPSLYQVIHGLKQAAEQAVREAEPTALTQPIDADVDQTQAYAPAPPPTSANRPAPMPDSSTSIPGVSGNYFDAVARIMAEVGEALEHAHQRGVIHRDIKPSNLILAPDGRTWVTDFGLARLQEQPGMTATGEFLGTPRYMSPEQIAPGKTPLDHRSDIFSLGATLYELLTWQPPFTGAGREEVLLQILEAEPPPPRRLNKKVPVDLDTICLKALEKEPARRYQSAGDFARDLRRYLAGLAISARRAGPVEKAAKWVRRRRALAAVVSVALLLALTAGFFAYQARVAGTQGMAGTQQAVLDKGLMEALSGDLDGALKSVREAESLGASRGQVRLLNGEVAFYRGKEMEAIDHLEKARELLPQSAAACGLLAMAYFVAGRGNEFEKTLRELETISPVSAEDFLFTGYAQSQWDP
jgi:tetratricopeptide (TPR) repeat protein